MDQRAETRWNVRHTAKLTVLGDPAVVMQAEITNVSGRGLRVVAGQRIALDVPVRIDFEDSLLLGEVAYCQPAGGEWAIGVELQHSLVHLAGLERLMKSLLDQDLRAREDQKVEVKQRR